MPKPDLRTPARRRTQQVLWGTLYAMILACAGLLAYLGLGGPEAIVAQDIDDIRVPASERGQLQVPIDEEPAPQPAKPAGTTPDRTKPSANETSFAAPVVAQPVSFFGIPIE